MAFSVAIIGRPNVGKSTLFNRLVGRRLALVDDTPGVTRDLREGEGKLRDLRFTVIDTAGLEEATDDSLQGRMRRLTEQAVEAADVCLFMIDARTGLTSSDRVFADILRKQGARVIVIANKCEGNAGMEGFHEAYTLGLGEPVRVSSEHGEGLVDLRDQLAPIAEEFAMVESDLPQIEVALDPDTGGELDPETGELLPFDTGPVKPMQIAIVGRPNAGKSTLVNRILGQDKMLTGPEAGITRDAIGTSYDWNGRPVKIFDTAGMRKRAKVTAKLEKMSVSDGLRAVKFSEVVVVLLDSQNPLETQDLRIADLAEREGRAVVIAVNKWDLVAEKQKALSHLRESVDRLLPQLRGVPLIMLSALDGKGIDRLHAAIMLAHERWNSRISTGKLNRWLLDMVARHPPPAPGGRRIRLRYMTQAKTRPPTFVAFASLPEDLPTAYQRYLINGLREEFKLHGTPVRLFFRKGENPYAGKAKKR